MPHSGDRYDVVVIGVGGAGSAALYHLAKRGAMVLGLEQFTVAHDRGSSHGLSRIIRLAYHEHPSYVPLLLRAYELWQELERESGQDLLTITGGIDASPAHQSGYNGFERALQSVQQHNLEHEVLTAAEVNERFPGYCLPEGFKALYQPQAGILASERCISAHVAAACQHGAQVHENEQVLGWRVDESSHDVLITTDKDCYRAGHVVFTAGSWLPALVPSLKDWCVVERQVIAWFEPQEPAEFDPSRFPVYLLQDNEDFWYGFPIFGWNGMKIGKFNHLKQVVQPDHLDRRIGAADEKLLRDAVQKFFPKANGPMTKTAACMFTNSPDHHFIIDTHPQHSQVVICSACSGHGFKFCSVLGEILADLTLTGTTPHDIELHRLRKHRTAVDRASIPYGNSPAPEFSKL